MTTPVIAAINSDNLTAIRNNAPDNEWQSLCDIVGTDPTATVATLPLATSAGWLWWWATDHCTSDWQWDHHALQALNTATATAANRLAALNTPIDQQIIWPDDIPTPEQLGVIRPLTDTQHRDTARLLHMHGGANFAVPGAGKSQVALVAAAGLKHRGDISQILVLAPISAHEAWATEPAAIFSDTTRPTVQIRPETPTANIAVYNYEDLQNTVKLDRLRLWVKIRPTLVIYDEVHRVKAGTSGIRGTAARELAALAARTMVLSGTPRPNTDTDLSNVLDLAYPGLGRSLIHSDAAPLRNAFTRTTKSELGLPDVNLTSINVPMSDAHDRVYDALIDAAARAVINDPSILDDVTRAGRIAALLAAATTDPTAVLAPNTTTTITDDLPDLNLDDLLTTLHDAVTPTKFTHVARMLHEHRANGTKVLVWACFKHHIARLNTILTQAGFNPAVITGDTPVNNPAAPTDRTRELHRFRTDPTCHVLLATPHTLSEGVSLHQTTTHQIHIDRPYNAAIFLQSLDRTHRLGLHPDANCTVRYLLATRTTGEDTTDHRIAQRLDTKIADMSRLLDDPDLKPLALPDTEETLDQDDLIFNGEAGDYLRALLGDRLNPNP